MINPFKKKRFLANKSQHQIAQEVGCSQSKISLLENGFIESKKFNEKEKRNLAKALKCKPKEIFEE